MNTEPDKDQFNNRASTLLLVNLYVGIVLRLFYSLTTAPAVRSYDYGGHLAYLRHVQSEWQVPAFDEGWQMYQPPLYYFTASGWSSLFGWGEESRILDVGLAKLFSLFLVLIAFAAEIAAGRVLFEERTEAMAMYCGAIAVWPTLVFFSARISNDVMAYFWGSQLSVHDHQRRGGAVSGLVQSQETVGLVYLNNMKAFHAGLAVIPELAVLSNKRRRSGLINRAQIEAIIRERRPDLIQAAKLSAQSASMKSWIAQNYRSSEKLPGYLVSHISN